MAGRFITIEGIEGCGKTTQVPMLGDYLESRGRQVTSTREPGGTPVAEAVRKLLLDPNVLYEFKVDSDNDYKADIAYQLTVKGNSHPQSLSLHRVQGESARKNVVENTARVIAEGKSTIPGKDPNIISGRNSKLFVGARQDPFFFNFKGIKSPVAIGLRFVGGVSMVDISLTPINDKYSVRGIGVAERVSTSTNRHISLNRSL